MVALKIKIRTIRLNKNISLRKLSEESGVTLSYLSELENGVKNNPTIDILCKIAKALEVLPTELFECE